MVSINPSYQDLNPHIHQALQILKHPFSQVNPRRKDTFASIIENLDFFQRNQGSTSNLKDFAELARDYLQHETHPYGTVLLQEPNYATKIYIVLQGKVQKIRKIGSEKMLESPLPSPKSPKNLRALQSKHSSPAIRHRRSMRSKGSIGSMKEVNQSINESSAGLSRATTLKAPLRLQSRGNSIIKGGREYGENENTSLNEIDEIDSEYNGVTNQESTRPTKETSFSPKGNAAFRGRHQRGKSSTFFQQNKRAMTLKISESFKTRRSDSEDLKTEGKVRFARDESDSSNRADQGSIWDFISRGPEVEKPSSFKESTAAGLVVEKTFEIGSCFGENFCRHQQPKENGMIVVVSEEAHFLTLTRESYLEIMNELAVRTDPKAIFFKQIFPSFDEVLVNKFSRYFEERSFLKGEKIYTKNDLANGIFFVIQGEVWIMNDKQQVPGSPSSGVGVGLNLAYGNSFFQSPKRKPERPIASISENQIFGEEFLLRKKARQYTAVANCHNTSVYCLETQDYEEMRDKFYELWNVLRSQAKEKAEWRQERVTEVRGYDLKLNISIGHSRTVSLNSLNTMGRSPVSQDVLVKQQQQQDKSLNLSQMIKKSFFRTKLLSPHEGNEATQKKELYLAKFSRIVQVASSKRDGEEKSVEKTGNNNNNNNNNNTGASLSRDYSASGKMHSRQKSLDRPKYDLQQFNLRKELEGKPDNEESLFPKITRERTTRKATSIGGDRHNSKGRTPIRAGPKTAEKTQKKQFSFLQQPQQANKANESSYTELNQTSQAPTPAYVTINYLDDSPKQAPKNTIQLKKLLNAVETRLFTPGVVRKTYSSKLKNVVT